jgi:hypothetical protein
MYHTIVVEKTKTYILYSLTFSKNRAVFEIMWMNMVETDRPQTTIKCGTCDFKWWITKATNKHSGYVIFIAFTRQQWFRERASISRYSYTACIVVNHKEKI